jgi:hypothetical protein
MNGTPPIVQTEHIDENMERLYIFFTVPTRYVDYGQLPAGAPHPMVAIAAVGKTTPIRLTRERTAVENCLQQLQNNVGCFIWDLSYFKLRQLETGEGTVIETTESLCRAHQDVVIYIYIYKNFYLLLINLFLVHIYHHHLIVRRITLVLPMLQLASMRF